MPLPSRASLPGSPARKIRSGFRRMQALRQESAEIRPASAGDAAAADVSRAGVSATTATATADAGDLGFMERLAASTFRVDQVYGLTVTSRALLQQEVDEAFHHFSTDLLDRAINQVAANDNARWACIAA